MIYDHKLPKPNNHFLLTESNSLSSGVNPLSIDKDIESTRNEGDIFDIPQALHGCLDQHLIRNCDSQISSQNDLPPRIIRDSLVDEFVAYRRADREFALSDSLRIARELGLVMAKLMENDVAIVLLTPNDDGYDDLPYRAIPFDRAIMDGRDIVERIVYNN